MEHDCAASDQRAPRGGLQLKRFYEGRHVHGVRPRGAMVGSGKGAGRVRATTGVVGRCWNTGRQVGTGETKRNERRGTYCFLTTYTGNVYKVQCTRQLRGVYKCGTRLCATAGRLGAQPSDASGLRSRCRNVSATLLLDLDLHPNVAGIGTLHLLLTLNSDLRSDVTRRASESEGRGRGGRVRLSGVGNESCAWAGMYSSPSGWHLGGVGGD